MTGRNERVRRYATTMMARSLRGRRSTGCGGATSARFSVRFRCVAPTTRLKQTKNRSRIDTRLAAPPSAAQTPSGRMTGMGGVLRLLSAISDSASNQMPNPLHEWLFVVQVVVDGRHDFLRPEEKSLIQHLSTTKSRNSEIVRESE